VKRIWFGGALLGLLLILGILCAGFMEDSHLEQAQQLNRAADLAAAGNWNAAKTELSKAHESWDKRSTIIAGLSDHEPMDQIEGSFAQLKVFAQLEDAASFASSCRYLAKQLEALGKSHSLNLQNFF
jgi:hypothetical protein